VPGASRTAGPGLPAGRSPGRDLLLGPVCAGRGEAAAVGAEGDAEHLVRVAVEGEQLLAGYEGQNDHDTLRADPVLKRAADRSPHDNDLDRLIRLSLHHVPDEGRTAMPTWTLPGRPGRLPAQGSHGSGRAQLRHPARPANRSHAPVARCDPPLATASTAIRRPCVDRGSGLDVPALFPDDGRLTRKPPSLHRLRAGRPVRRLRRYYEALRLLPALRPRLIGFAEDLPPSASDEFAPFCGSLATAGPGYIEIS
jgi:hypothetical protein